MRHWTGTERPFLTTTTKRNAILVFVLVFAATIAWMAWRG